MSNVNIVNKVSVLLTEQMDYSSKRGVIVGMFKDITPKQLMNTVTVSAGEALKICSGEVVTCEDGSVYWVESWDLL